MTFHISCQSLDAKCCWQCLESLKCKREGHICKECRTPWCKKCRNFRHGEEECVNTYASKVRAPVDEHASEYIMGIEQEHGTAEDTAEAEADMCVHVTGEANAAAKSMVNEDNGDTQNGESNVEEPAKRRRNESADYDGGTIDSDRQ